MPIYEFTCASCGKLSEAIQHLGDRPPICPSCGSKRMKRAVSRTSFQLKGGGWYADLYGTPRPGAAGTDDRQEAKPAETKPEASKGSATEKPAASKPPAPPAASDSSEPRSSRPSRRRPASPRRRR
jgi:putative FmdB family regulatory protein